MTKHLRYFSTTKVYHIIIKGIDDSDIFYDFQDKKVFLDKLLITKKDYKFKIYAYCLMNNHVHLVLEVEDENLSTAIQSLTLRYISYFNKKYDRKGPFVQERFKSKNVENQRYFLEVCRYVHRNPEKANIKKTYEYEWSSYHEYVGKEKIIDKNILMHYFDNNLNEFVKYTNKTDDISELERMADFELKTTLTDEEVIYIILKKFELNEVEEIPKFFKTNKADRNTRILALKDIVNTNVSQLARIIRIERRTIAKICQKGPGPNWHKNKNCQKGPGPNWHN